MVDVKGLKGLERRGKFPPGLTYEEWKGVKAGASVPAAEAARPSLWRRIKAAVKQYIDSQRVFGLVAPGFGPRRRKTVKLPKAEYARVQSAIATNYSKRFEGKYSGSMAVGDYVYRFEVEEKGVYRIVGKRKIRGV